VNTLFKTTLEMLISEGVRHEPDAERRRGEVAAATASGRRVRISQLPAHLIPALTPGSFSTLRMTVVSEYGDLLMISDFPDCGQTELQEAAEAIALRTARCGVESSIADSLCRGDDVLAVFGDPAGPDCDGSGAVQSEQYEVWLGGGAVVAALFERYDRRVPDPGPRTTLLRLAPLEGRDGVLEACTPLVVRGEDARQVFLDVRAELFRRAGSNPCGEVLLAGSVLRQLMLKGWLTGVQIPGARPPRAAAPAEELVPVGPAVDDADEDLHARGSFEVHA